MENAGSGDIALPAGDGTAATPAATGESAARMSLTMEAKERALLLLVGALAIGLAFWWLQFSTASICCGDYDSYYHFRWSRMLWESLRAGHFPPRFDALPLTTLNPKDYVDHHLLFHIFQIPFTWFGDFRVGAKVGTWLFACAAVFSCYWLIIRYRLSYPLAWLVALLGSSAPFLYRIHMGKAMSVSIVMLVAGIYFLFERKYLWLLPLAFVFALTYDMVFLLWVAAGVWLLVTLWVEQSFNKAVVRAAVAVGLVIAGTALGYIINPYFPHNIQLVYEHLLMKVTPKDFSTPVGGEWYPYNTWEFLGNCGVAAAAMLAGYIAFRDSTKKESQRTLFFLIFSTFLMIVNARWRRFSEYWPPFAILFAAFALQPLIERARARSFVTNESDGSGAGEASEAVAAEPIAARPEGSQATERAERSRAMELATVALATALLAAPMAWYLYVTSKDIAGMSGPDLYRGGMEWVSKNVPRDEPLFNADWDDFPKLFFYDPQRPYIAGLDPTYLLDQNPELMKHYADIGTGKEENPGPVIREKFCVGEGDRRRCARYAFLDHEHEAFYNNALDSGWFDEVYADDDCIILRVRDAKGDPPPDNPQGAGKDESDEGDAQDGDEATEGKGGADSGDSKQ
jgi:hypothetical protein